MHSKRREYHLASFTTVNLPCSAYTFNYLGRNQGPLGKFVRYRIGISAISNYNNIRELL